MAGHDDGNRIARIAVSYRAGRAWPADAAGEFRIRDGMAVGDVAKRSPDGGLKCRPFSCQRQVELPQPAIEIGLQLHNRSAERLRHIVTDPIVTSRRTVLVVVGMQADE